MRHRNQNWVPRGLLRITSLLVLVVLSQQYVEEILQKPPPPPSSGKCKDCDVTELPDGSLVFAKCDPYSEDNEGVCGADGSKSYDCCTGYQLMEKTRNLHQPKQCPDEPKNWNKCLEQMSLHGDVSPIVSDRINELFGNGTLDKEEMYTIFIMQRGQPKSDKIEEDSLEDYQVIKGKYFSHDFYTGLKLKNALKEDRVHEVARYQDMIFLDCDEVLEADRECANGVVHLLKRPLVPLKPEGDVSLYDQLESDESLKEFASLIPAEKREELKSMKGTFTILAPTADQFAELRKNFTEEELGQIALNMIVEEDIYCLGAMIRKGEVTSPNPTTIKVTPVKLKDTDGDGIPDRHDPDIDGDGIPNDEDEDADGDGQPDKDTDGDGIPDILDSDIDGDGIPNEEDEDIDGDGIPNEEDEDIDGDGIPNEEDDDADGDGQPDKAPAADTPTELKAMCNEPRYVTVRDQVRPGGVIHTVNGPIIPMNLMDDPCREWLEANNATKFFDYMAECDRKLADGKKHTYAYATDDAFEWFATYEPFKEQYQRFQDDLEYRCKVIRFHIMPSEDDTPNGDLAKRNDTLPFKTTNSDPELHNSLYHGPDDDDKKCFHYGENLDDEPLELRDSWVYRIDKVLVPPEKRIVDIVDDRNEEDLGITDKLLDELDANKTIFEPKSPNNLFLVAKDDSLDDIFTPEGNDKSTGEFNAPLAENYNLMHHVPKYLWGNDIGYFKPGVPLTHNNSLDIPLIFERDPEDPSILRVGYADIDKDEWPKVIEFNDHAIDGMVWVLDGPVPLPAHLRPKGGDACTSDFKGELPECLKDKDVDQWWDYLKECDLYMEEGKKYTFVFPTGDAFEWWSQYVPFEVEEQRFKDDADYRCRVIRYHLIPTEGAPATQDADELDTVMKPTNNREGLPLRQNVYESPDESPDGLPKNIHFHYGRVLDEKPTKVGDVSVVRVDKVLVMPEKNITDVVGEKPEFGKFKDLHEKTDAGDIFEDNGLKNLHLVVKDEDLEGVVDTEAMPDDQAKKFVKGHTIPRYLWGGDIGYFKPEKSYDYPATIDGETVTFKRTTVDGEDVLLVGYVGIPEENWSKVVEYNIPARDGIVWVLDRPLQLPGDCSMPGKLDVKGPLPACLADKNVDQWWNYLKECDLYMDENVFTMSMPTNDAFDWWKGYAKYEEQYTRFMDDKEYRCAVIRYHITKSPSGVCTFHSSQPNSSVHFQTNNVEGYAPNWQNVFECAHESPLGFPKDVHYHYARVLDDGPAVSFDNAQVIRLDKVTMLPEQNITEFVASNEDCSEWKMVQNQGEAGDLFQASAPRNLHLIVRDPGMDGVQVSESTSNRFIKLHTIHQYLWGGDLGYFKDGNQYSYKNSLGMEVLFLREGDVLRIGHSGIPTSEWSTVVEFDHFARDGIVWVLDKPLDCPAQFCPAEECDTTLRLNFKEDIPDCLRPKLIDQFWGYMQECELYMDEAKEYEILMPVNESFEWWKKYAPFKEEYDRFMNDKEYRCQTIRYHIHEADAEKPNVSKGQVNETVHFSTNNVEPMSPQWQSLYYMEGESKYAAPMDIRYHYGRVMDKEPIRNPGTYLTRLDKLLVIPEKNLVDIVASKGEDFSAIKTITDASKYGAEYVDKKRPKVLYLISNNVDLAKRFDAEGQMKGARLEVPVQENSNGTIEQEQKTQVQDEMEPEFNPEYSNQFTLFRTIPNYLWGGSIGYYEYDRMYEHQNALNFTLQLIRERTDDENGRLIIGYEGLPRKEWAPVSQYNLRARDGMVWVIGDLPCPETLCDPTVYLDIDIYTLNVVSCRRDHFHDGIMDKSKFSKQMLSFADKNPDDCLAIKVNDYINTGIVHE